MMVIVTTLFAPPVLKHLIGPVVPSEIEVKPKSVADLVSEL
jgi:hypothetical protein